MKIGEFSSIRAARAWPKIIANYRTPHRGRSAFELAVTLIPFAGLWALSWVAVHYDFWWGLLLTIPAAGFLLRLFMIQHDCGHGSFFAHRHTDDWTGRVIGVLTMTPYDYWRRAHATHHASAGQSRRARRRRHHDADGGGVPRPVAVGPHRLPALSSSHCDVRGRAGLSLPVQAQIAVRHDALGRSLPWVSTMATNLAIAIVAAGLIWLIGLVPFLVVHLPIVIFAAAAGVWLFYVQHQFEGRTGRSSRMAVPGGGPARLVDYDLPRRAQMADRQYRHPSCALLVEQVPLYRLPEVLAGSSRAEERRQPHPHGKPACVQLVLWDENRQPDGVVSRGAGAGGLGPCL